MDGFYQPYWTQPDELEHFGVKGMKWGVRKEEDRSSASRMISEKMTNSLKDGTHDYPNANLRDAYTIYETVSQANFKQIYNKAIKKKGNNNFTPEENEAMWQQAYQQAADELLENISVDQRLALVAYAALEQKGIAQYFDVSITENNGKKNVLLVYKYTGESFTSVSAAFAFIKRLKLSGTMRYKMVDEDATPVKVKKRTAIGGGPINEDAPSQSFFNSAQKVKDLRKASNDIVSAGETMISSIFKKVKR